MRKNIFKKMALLSGLVMSALAITGFKSVSGTSDGDPKDWDIDKNQFIYDYANVFSDSEELEFQERAETFKKEFDLDIIIVSATNLGTGATTSDSVMDRNEREYAEGFYLKGGYGDGILCLIDEQYGGLYITRSGLAEVYISDSDHEVILDRAFQKFEKYKYYACADVFFDNVEDIVGDCVSDSDFEELKEAWVNGNYVYYDEFWRDYSNKIEEAHRDTIFTMFKSPMMCILIGLVVAVFSVLFMCISSGTKMTANSRTYMRGGSFNILHRFDRFTHTTTTSRKVSSSSSGGSGRSSSHRSGGRSFSGGGRRR